MGMTRLRVSYRNEVMTVPTKVVLRQDVPKLGEKGTVQSVKGGFARNYLIPQGLAVIATPGEIKMVEENQKVAGRRIAKQEQQLQALSDKIDGQTLTFTARASAQGRLFGSVTSGDIVERLQGRIGEAIDRRKVVLDEPIRTIGRHAVTINLVGRLRPQVTVVVDAEEIEDAAATPAATADVATPPETPEGADVTASAAGAEVPSPS